MTIYSMALYSLNYTYADCTVLHCIVAMYRWKINLLLLFPFVVYQTNIV